MSVAGPRRLLQAILLPLAAYVVLAIAMTWPLAMHLSTALPGPPGDNVAFLWNFWWMREALASGASPFWTPQLFAPYGVDLTLNTHTALPAFIGATLLSPLNIVATQNVMTIVALALNGFAAFRLALSFTTDRVAAFIGGVIFALSAYISAHLLGHFNLISAYVLPLFVLCWMKAVRTADRTQVRFAIAAGVVLGATAFIDYYYLVYAFAIGALVVVVEGSVWSMRRSVTTGPLRWLMWTAGLIALLVAAVILLIAITSGFQFDLGSIHVSMRSTYNPRQIFWLFAGIWMLLWWSPRWTVRLKEGVSAKVALQTVAVAGALFLVLASPLIWRGVALMASGDYVSQRYFWRSAPGGIDLATLALGNPLHPIWGDGVLAIYNRLGLSQTESLAWLGLVPMWLAWRVIQREGPTFAVRLWLVLGGVFFLWALGPHLRIFDWDTGMILPQTVLRYVPIVSNARMPARAIVVVSLAVAMLSALAMARLRQQSGRTMLMTALVVLGVVADNLPAPFPLLALERPAIYSVLRDRPENGALCELPVGTQDGFGTMGALDPRALFYQTIHGRPIVGGMISRLPVSVRDGYENDFVISSLLRLSEPRPLDAETRALPTRQQTIDALTAKGVAFVMLDRQSAPPVLVEFVEHELRLTEIGRDDRRTLYRLVP